MVIDILGRVVSLGITGDADSIRVLVDADVIESHVRRHVFRDGGIDAGKIARHAQVHDDGHWFDGDQTLSDVSVWPDPPPVQRPGLVAAHEPRHVAVCARRVLERVRLVVVAAVPVVVEVGHTRHGLLVYTTAVAVD